MRYWTIAAGVLVLSSACIDESTIDHGQDGECADCSTQCDADSGCAEHTCASICAGRDQRVAQDFWCFDTAECLSFCETYAMTWDDDNRADFADCADSNPLCYVSPATCMGV